jgi:ATP-binding cassette subfamily D (ALD) protein 4
MDNIYNIFSICVLERDAYVKTTAASLFAVALVYETAASYIMTIISRFYEAITNDDLELFMSTLWLSVLLIVLISFLRSLKRFLADYNALLWREGLVIRLIQILDSPDACVSLHSDDGRTAVDNVDQRISQDVDLLSSKLAEATNSVTTAPFIIAYYSYYLYTIFGIYPPIVCYAWFLIGVILSRQLMAPIASLVYAKEKQEGGFRFALVTFLESLESILFLKGTSSETARLKSRFAQVYGASYALLQRHILINSFAEFFSYGGSILTYFLVGMSLMYGYSSELSAGERASLLSRGSFSCMYLLSGFSTILTAYSEFGDISGLSLRIVTLMEFTKSYYPVNLFDVSRETHSGYSILEMRDNLTPMKPSEVSINETGERVLIRVTGLCVETLASNSRILLPSVSFTVSEGMTLIITGETACGKTMLLRQIAGVASCNRTGKVDLYTQRIFFSPQIPYCFKGSLEENVIYPDLEMRSANHAEDQELINSLLGQLSLTRLASTHSIQGEVDWPNVLSPGEKQLISICRILYHKPDILFLDESTSALDEDTQDKVYTILKRECRTFVSVGHRASLMPYHSHQIKITNGKAEFRKIVEES